ncbi:MAG TPA: methylated-DNA--[protein]-cysteine S-methyltransferase [Thermodesulfovibrionales bacterium]|nr:methylated-DNA--[protein]-cysteine S-methyltransferase [Thermodesulfovibrionales bacterium]
MKKKRSSNTDSFYEVYESPVGDLYLIFAGKDLCAIEFSKPVDIPLKKSSSSPLHKELKEFFKHGKDLFEQTIALAKGTDFDYQVWMALKEIPFGETRTYKWLAEKIGRPNASRAVGQSLGRNPIPIVLPCHRIIESDGSIGGFSSGTDVKRRLLEIEYYIKLTRS